MGTIKRTWSMVGTVSTVDGGHGPPKGAKHISLAAMLTMRVGTWDPLRPRHGHKVPKGHTHTRQEVLGRSKEQRAQCK